MTRYSGADVGAVLVDGYSVHSYLTDLDLDVAAVVEESHAFGDGWAESLYAGFRSFTFTQKGFYDDTVLVALDAAVQAGNQGQNRVVSLVPATNAWGKRFVGLQGPAQAAYKRTAARGVLHKAQVDFKGSGAVDEGFVHWPLSALTAGASGTGTMWDHGVSSALGGAAYLQVTALTLGGYTNLAGLLQHSADNITYAALATFAVVTAAPAAERVAVAVGATINRYTRFDWSYNGAGAGQSATAFAGFARYGVPIESNNLAANGSFETNTTGWADSAQGVIARTGAQAYRGSFSGSVTSSGAGSNAVTTSGSNNMDGAPLSQTPRTIVVWALGEGATIGKTLTLTVNETGGATGTALLGGTAAQTIVLTSAWQRITFTGTPTQADRTGVNTTISVPAAAGAEVYYIDGFEALIGSAP